VGRRLFARIEQAQRVVTGTVIKPVTSCVTRQRDSVGGAGKVRRSAEQPGLVVRSFVRQRKGSPRSRSLCFPFSLFPLSLMIFRGVIPRALRTAYLFISLFIDSRF